MPWPNGVCVAGQQLWYEEALYPWYGAIPNCCTFLQSLDKDQKVAEVSKRVGAGSARFTGVALVGRWELGEAPDTASHCNGLRRSARSSSPDRLHTSMPTT